MISNTDSGTYSPWTVRFGKSGETTPRSDPVPKDDEDLQRPVRDTVARISRHEKGDHSTKDRYELTEADAGVSIAVEVARAERRIVAKEITDTLTRAIANHGTIRLATTFQLLRRSLSKCHDVLRGQQSESDFLSIVVLAEKALSQENWREVSKNTLQQLKVALALGETAGRVTYDDYNRVFRLLNATGSVSGPVLEFDDETTSIDG